MRPVPALSARDAAPAGDCDEMPRQARISAHAPDVPDPQAGFYIAPISTRERSGDEVLARVLLALLIVLFATGALFACDAMAKMDPVPLIQPYDPFNPTGS